MIKHTQAIRRQQPTNCLKVFDHFVGLALKGLISMHITEALSNKFKSRGQFESWNMEWSYVFDFTY